MENKFSNLVKQIGENEALSISELNLKFKQLGSEVVATLLFPLVVHKLEKGIELTTLKQKQIAGIRTLKSKYKKYNLKSILLIAGEMKEVISELMGEGYIYLADQDSLSKSANHYILTLNGETEALKSIIEKYNIFYALFDFSVFYTYNGVAYHAFMKEEINLNEQFAREKVESEVIPFSCTLCSL
jgi:hypothetical protein